MRLRGGNDPEKPKKHARSRKTSCIFLRDLVQYLQRMRTEKRKEDTCMQDMQDMMRRLNQSGKRLSKGHRKIAE